MSDKCQRIWEPGLGYASSRWCDSQETGVGKSKEASPAPEKTTGGKKPPIQAQTGIERCENVWSGDTGLGGRYVTFPVCKVIASKPNAFKPSKTSTPKK